MEAAWAEFVDSTSPFVMSSWYSLALAVVVYYVHGFLYLILDVSHFPNALYKRKLQPKVPFDVRTLPKLLSNLAFGNVAVMLPLSLLSGYLTEWNLGLRVSPSLPPLQEVLLHMGVYLVAQEVLFYYSHLALHRPFLYKRIHKVHHQYTSPIALAAAYAHPLEVLVSNVLPLYLPAILLRSHILTYWMWVVIAVIGTQVHHSGYRMPWHPPFDHQPDFHDFHHERFTANYGLLGVLDYLHGTDRVWRETLAKAKKKH